MTLLPEIPSKSHLSLRPDRFRAQLIESSWRILDSQAGEFMGKARYTVEIQARFAANALNRAYAMGFKAGRQGEAGLTTRGGVEATPEKTEVESMQELPYEMD